MLSAYNYEVSPGIYVGAWHAGLYERVFKWLKKNVTSKEHILIIRRDRSVPEGFSEEYINWESRVVSVDGLKLFRSFHTSSFST